MASALKPGDRVGSYEIRELVGRGGMGEVYQALQPSFNRIVAIKVVPPHLAADREFAARFQREAITLGRLNHPNILPAYDAGTDLGHLYLVMPYAGGGTLRQWLNARDGQPVPLDEAIRILEPIASALDHAHAHNVIHRDLKPSNILFGLDGEVFLADFGIARLSDAAPITIAGHSVGTLDFIAPEQEAGRPLDGRADVYSLAVILSEMLTGRPVRELRLRYPSRWRPLTQVNPAIPHWVQDAISKSLSTNPDDRHATAAELIAALRPPLAPRPATDYGTTTGGLTATGPAPRATPDPGAVFLPPPATYVGPPGSRGSATGSEPAPTGGFAPNPGAWVTGPIEVSASPRSRTTSVALGLSAGLVTLLLLVTLTTWTLSGLRPDQGTAQAVVALTPSPVTAYPLAVTLGSGTEGALAYVVKDGAGERPPLRLEIADPRPGLNRRETVRLDGQFEGIERPVWSYDGCKLALVALSSAPDRPAKTIYALDVISGKLTHVTPATPARSTSGWPNWTPDGRIFFETDRNERDQFELYVADSEGKWTIPYDNKVGKSGAQPAWSPDGNWVAFAYPTTTLNVYLSRVLQRETRKVGEASGLIWSENPTWSPDSRQILFAGRRQNDSPDFDVYMHGLADGSERRIVGWPNTRESVPTFSHDGRWITFASDHGLARDRYRLYRMSAGSTSDAPGQNVEVVDTGGAEPLPWLSWGRGCRQQR